MCVCWFNPMFDKSPILAKSPVFMAKSYLDYMIMVKAPFSCKDPILQNKFTIVQSKITIVHSNFIILRKKNTIVHINITIFQRKIIMFHSVKLPCF